MSSEGEAESLSSGVRSLRLLVGPWRAKKVRCQERRIQESTLETGAPGPCLATGAAWWAS